MTRYSAPRRRRCPALHRHPHVRPRAARHRRRRASTSRSSASRSTPRPRCARARASAPPASATPRCCCGRGTRRRTSTSSARCRSPTSATWTTTPGNAERTADADRRAARAGAARRRGAARRSAATTRSCSASCARTPPCTGRSRVVLLDAHADTWEQYYGERYFHGTPFKRALEEGLIDPHRSLLAGMRGSLYAASDLDEPRAWGFEIVPCDELRTWTPAEYAAAGARRGSATGPRSCRSTSTASTPRSRPPPARPRCAGCCRTRRSRFLRALRGHALHRLRPRRGRARLRHQRADDRAAGGQHRLRVPHPDSTVSCVSGELRGAVVALEVADDEQAQ